MKYTIKDFKKQFPNDEACMQYIIQSRFGDKTLYPVKGRESVYADSEGNHYSPLAGTIFHKSSTPLTDWFYIIYLFVTSKNGISAKEIQRQIGVTYKTAWRMGQQIRKGFADKNISLSGTVEADETYIGGKRRGKRGRGAEGKTAVFGMRQRGGNIKAQVVSDVRAHTLQSVINDTVEKGSEILTDEFLSYNRVKIEGYDHKTIRHGVREYVKGRIHTNSIEGFWGQLKRSINGTFHAVSPAYLQAYLDEFSWKYNHRESETPLFHLLLKEVVKAS